MSRWLKALVASIAIISSLTLFAAEESDPILDKLAKAKATYQRDIEKYQMSVAGYFDKREETARKNGDKKAVDQIKAERQEFEEIGSPAKLPAALKAQFSTARSSMEIAYKSAIREYVKTKQDDRAAGVEEELAAFGKPNDIVPFTETASGLKYRVLRKGEGPKPKQNSTVKVHYKGWLDDGKVFDSSYDRGMSIDFPLNAVINGWTEGLQLVGKGGMIELEIPSNLAYGDKGKPPQIPEKATLHFTIELLDVK